MESVKLSILLYTTPFYHPKTTLMLSRTLINRLIILSFMVLVGFSLGKSIRAASTWGLILSLVSLGAGIYFLYLLGKARQQMEMEAEETN